MILAFRDIPVADSTADLMVEELAADLRMSPMDWADALLPAQNIMAAVAKMVINFFMAAKIMHFGGFPARFRGQSPVSRIRTALARAMNTISGNEVYLQFSHIE